MFSRICRERILSNCPKNDALLAVYPSRLDLECLEEPQQSLDEWKSGGDHGNFGMDVAVFDEGEESEEQ